MNSDGTPEGSLEANPGSLCMDRTNGEIYKKDSGTGNTGWEILESGTDVPTSFAGNSGTAVPVANILNIVGTGGATTSGSGDTLTIDASGAGISSFTTDSGSAAAAGGILSVLGGTGTNTSGATSVITVNIDSPVIVTNGGTGLTTITDGGVMVGSGTGAVTVLGQATNGQLIIGSTGVDPVLATLASADASVTITNGAGTIDLAAGAAVPVSFTTDSGSAVPALGILSVVGSHGINTNGATSIVDIEIDNAIVLGDLVGLGAGVDALTLTTGDLSITSGNFNLPTTADANNGVIEVNSVAWAHSYGTNNIFLGAGAGNFTISSSGGVTAVGSNAGSSLTTGYACTFIGRECGAAATSSISGTGIGWGCLESLLGGHGNVALGVNTANAITSGGDNTLIGTTSGLNLISGDGNTAIGNDNLQNLATGSYNSILGDNAGNSITLTDSDNILIMNSGVAGDNNKIRIGTQGAGNRQQNSTFIAGIAGVTVSSNETSVVIDTATGELGVGSATGIVAISAPTDSGTATPSAGALTFAGAGGISTSGSGSTVTITGATGVLTWTVVTDATQAMAINSGYIGNRGTAITFTLPTTAAVGDIVEVTNFGAGLPVIAQNASEQIHFTASSTTVGVGGSLTSVDQFGSLRMVCSVANNEWMVISSTGSWTIV